MKQKLLYILCIILLTAGTGHNCSKKDSEANQNKNRVNKMTTPVDEKNPQVLIKTSLGDIKVELFKEKAPLTVENFLKYVESKFYDGTIFHRVISTFMIQGGGFTSGLTQKVTSAPIKNEAANGLSNERGTIAMARTQIVDSATAQFFINVKDNIFLDHKTPSPQGFGYCVFGRVFEGMDVVDKIKDVPTGSVGPFSDVPVDDVTILSISKIK